MERLKKYTKSYYDSNDITAALLNLSGVTEEAREDIENAVYYIDAAAQNEYNHDYFRVLYNTLLSIAEKHA